MSAVVTPLSVDRAALPVVDCAACGRRSLVYLDVSGDADVQRCLACDAAIGVDVPINLANERGMSAIGYALIHTARKPPRTKAKSKCGANGVRGCGTGGCSSGSCGTGGGCSSGGCGTR